MGIYVVNVVLLTVVGLIVEKCSTVRWHVKAYCFYAFLQMTLLAAFRIDVGIDYSQYYHAFYRVAKAPDWNSVLELRYEVGYLAINRIISLFTDNVILFMGIYHGIMYGLFMLYVYRYCEEKWLSVMAFVVLDYYAMSFCFMRQGMAIVIGLFALEFIRRRRWYLAVPLALFAASFHASALVLLLYLLLSYVNWRPRWVRIFAVASGVLLYAGCDFLLEHAVVGPFAKYADYLNSPFMEGNPFWVVFYPVFCVVVFLVFRKDVKDESHTLDNVVPVIFVGMVLELLSTRHYIIERIALYATIYNVNLVSMVVCHVKDRGQRRNEWLAIACALLIGAGAFVFGITSDRYAIVPYQVALEQMHSVPWLRSMSGSR